MVPEDPPVLSLEGGGSSAPRGQRAEPRPGSHGRRPRAVGSVFSPGLGARLCQVENWVSTGRQWLKLPVSCGQGSEPGPSTALSSEAGPCRRPALLLERTWQPPGSPRRIERFNVWRTGSRNFPPTNQCFVYFFDSKTLGKRTSLHSIWKPSSSCTDVSRIHFGEV